MMDKLFEIVGISGMGQDSEEVEFIHPVGAILVSTVNETPQSYGTWEMVDSGPLLGGQIGMVYAWQRTA